MEVIQRAIDYTRPDVFKIYPIGDIHGGSVHCAEKKLRDKIEQIKGEKNSYILGMGDLTDCIIADDKRWDEGGVAGWVERDNIVESQRRWIKEILYPVRKKIIGLLEGNHELEIHRRYQIAFTRNLCQDLDVPYGGYACFAKLTFQRKNTGHIHVYTIHAWHGAGSAVTEGARLMRLKRLIDAVEADIFLMGHLHTITSYCPLKLALRGGRIKNLEKIACVTGSWLKSYSQATTISYSERAGYPPSIIGCPCILISPDKDYIKLEI